MDEERYATFNLSTVGCATVGWSTGLGNCTSSNGLICAKNQHATPSQMKTYPGYIQNFKHKGLRKGTSELEQLLAV